MRKLLALCVALIATLSMPARAATPLQTEADSLSYALGTFFGQNIGKMGISDFNAEAFTDAVVTLINGTTPLMSEQQAGKILQAFQEKMIRRNQEQMEQKAATNREAGRIFLAENGARAEVVTTPSGLQYEVLKQGDGPKPTANDKVKVHYTGRLLDGSVFDSSVERGEPATFGVTQVIPGWVEALQLMNQGAKWRVYIPADIAYGDSGAGPIEPGSTLIFDIELLEVIK